MGSLEILIYALAVAGFLAFNAFVRNRSVRDRNAQEAVQARGAPLPSGSEEWGESGAARAHSAAAAVIERDAETVVEMAGRTLERSVEAIAGRVSQAEVQRTRGAAGDVPALGALALKPAWRESFCDPAGLRRTVVLMTVMGPCRANNPHEQDRWQA